MSAQLHLSLIGVSRDEPLNIVMTAPDKHCVEAWRRLTGHYEPAAVSPPKPSKEWFLLLGRGVSLKARTLLVIIFGLES